MAMDMRLDTMTTSRYQPTTNFSVGDPLVTFIVGVLTASLASSVTMNYQCVMWPIHVRMMELARVTMTMSSACVQNVSLGLSQNFILAMQNI